MATEIQSAGGAAGRARNATGFTTIELVVVIVVTGIIAAVVMPRLDLISGFDQSGFRDQMLASLDYARKAAVAARRYVCVDASSGSAVNFKIDTREPDAPVPSFAGTTVCTGATGVALPLPKSPQAGTGAGTIAAPTSIGVASSVPLVFDALGRPVSSASLSPLAADATVTISGTSAPLTLTVAAGSGLVH